MRNEIFIFDKKFKVTNAFLLLIKAIYDYIYLIEHCKGLD